MDWLEKQLRLQQQARSDEIYSQWNKDFQSARDAFREYADSQPEEIRQILWQYADSGRLMYQRLVTLACMHMDFPDE